MTIGSIDSNIQKAQGLDYGTLHTKPETVVSRDEAAEATERRREVREAIRKARTQELPPNALSGLVIP